MQGVILNVGEARSLILGDDGQRYAFTPTGWGRDDVQPEIGMRVDFEVQGTDVYPIPDATTPTPPAADAPVRIAFTSNRDGDSEIYVMNADGSGVTRLTNSGGDHPSWSPDGRRIAFTSNGDGDSEIYVMNADGSGVTRLTNNDAVGINDFSWSPDGRRIAFTSNGDGDSEIYVMNADGSGVTRLTNSGGYHPSWSPAPK